MPTQPQPSDILLLGIGGGASMIVADIVQNDQLPLRALCIDTDASALAYIAEKGIPTLLLGGTRLAGRGTGGDCIKGRMAIQDDIETLTPHLQGVRTVMLLACLGSGTGSGAVADVVKHLHSLGIATCCVITLPFKMEGASRQQTAERTVPMIEEYADALVTLPLDTLYASLLNEPLSTAIVQANTFLADGLTLLFRLVAQPGYISLDSSRLNMMVRHGGISHFASFEDTGHVRMMDLSLRLKASKVLRSGDILGKAKTVLVGILAGDDLRLKEIDSIMTAISSLCKKTTHIELGTVLDNQLQGKISVVIFAFENAMPMQTAAAPQQIPTLHEISTGIEPPLADIAIPVTGKRSKASSRAGKLASIDKGRGRFHNVDPTLWNGQDLDIPTYQRRDIILER